MLGLPKSTEISIPLYKKDLLENYHGPKRTRDAFNAEVKSVKVVNELSPRSLPIADGQEVHEIFVVEVELKEDDVSRETAEAVFSMIPQTIVIAFVGCLGLRIAAKYVRVFMTDTMPLDYNLEIGGLDMDGLRQSIVEAVGGFSVRNGRNLRGQVDHEMEMESIRNQIAKLEDQKAKIKTPARKHDIHLDICRLKDQLEDLRRS